MTEQTFYCLIDRERTIAFKKAIKNTIKKGDIVVDMGTGTGILAFFAAAAGAKRVYAIENDSHHFDKLTKNIALNGYQNKIVLISGDVTRMTMPEKVDVIIGEMIATGLIEELQIPAMNNVLKYAKRNVRVLINHFENYVDLVFNKDTFYKHKLQIIRYEFPDFPCLKSVPFSDKYLYSKIDLSKVNKNNRIDKEIIISIAKEGLINGLRISSKSIFCDGSTLEGTCAYSYPLIFPLEDLRVKKGDKFRVNLSYRLCEGLEKFKYNVSKM